MNLLGGIDEAGRGPLIGPLIVALCCCPDPEKLLDLGVADSKSFGAGVRARARRAEICRTLFESCLVRWVQIPARVIDRYVTGGPGLNALEQQAAAFLLGQVPAMSRVVADGERLFSPLAVRFSGLVAVNRADARFPEVAAASIIAKTFRDDWMDAYERRMGHLGFVIRGGGYPNASTRAFVEQWKQRHGGSPPHLRSSWKIRSISQTGNLFDNPDI